MVAIELERGVEDAWWDGLAFVPKLAAFLVALVIGCVVVKLVARVVKQRWRQVLDRYEAENPEVHLALQRARESHDRDSSETRPATTFRL